MSAPGWYPDPEVPGAQRWWDGSDWTDLTQGHPGPAGGGFPGGGGPDGPYGAAGYGGAGYGGPTYGSVSTLAPPHPADVLGTPFRPTLGERFGRWRQRPGAVPMLVVGGVLILVVVLAVGLVAGRSGGSPTAAPPTFPGQASQSPDPGAFPPGTIRLFDPDAGLSYLYLGEGWLEVATTGRDEVTSLHGQYIVTQPSTPDGGEFIAEVSSGPLDPRFGASGADSYAAVIEEVAASLRANYYPAPNERRDLAAGPVALDGAPGYLVRFDLSWDVPGYDSTGERVAVLLLDTGREQPALVYISIPNTHAELYGVVDRVIESIELY